MYCFFFNDTATTEIYTLSLHDALPIWIFHVHRAPEDPVDDDHQGKYQGSANDARRKWVSPHEKRRNPKGVRELVGARVRSEEHTSELQSRQYLVCRLLLEKKKKYISQ